MSFEYLIDGYNFLLRRPVKQIARGPGNLERARSALLAWLSARLPAGSKATVVFDSSLATGSSHSVNRRDEFGVCVYYAGGYPTADALIGEFCLHCPTPERLIVVSDDNEVTSWAEKCRVRAISCSEFDDILHRPSPSSGPRPSRPQPAPELDKPNSITAEEMKYWQEEFSGDDPIDDPDDAPLPIERRLPPPPPADLTWPDPKKAKKTKKPRPVDSEERFRRELDDLTEFYQTMLADEAERKAKTRDGKT